MRRGGVRRKGLVLTQMVRRTRVEDSSSNKTLWLEIDEETLIGNVNSQGMGCRFRVTCCRDENEDLVATAKLGEHLGRIIESCFISILTIKKNEVRIILDVPMDGAWGLFEIFGRTLDHNDYAVDTDRWEIN